MQRLIEQDLGDRVAVIACTNRSDGDLSPSMVEPTELADRRHRLVPLPWMVLRQVHSDRVITVTGATDTASRPVADALVSSHPGVAMAVHAGDCAPIGLVAADGTIGLAHAGWKGLEAGVIESTVRRLGSDDVVAVVGPHIHKESYEFGTADLHRLSERFGTSVAAVTSDNKPAFDLTVAIARELERLDVRVVSWSPDCTAADPHRYWSHRARAETGRIAMVGWLSER